MQESFTVLVGSSQFRLRAIVAKEPELKEKKKNNCFFFWLLVYLAKWEKIASMSWRSQSRRRKKEWLFLTLSSFREERKKWLRWNIAGGVKNSDSSWLLVHLEKREKKSWIILEQCMSWSRSPWKSCQTAPYCFENQKAKWNNIKYELLTLTTTDRPKILRF